MVSARVRARVCLRLTREPPVLPLRRCRPVGIMQSMDSGEQIIHGGCPSSVGPPCLSPNMSSFEYDVNVESAATYYLTANVSTWHPNQDVSLSAVSAIACHRRSRSPHRLIAYARHVAIARRQTPANVLSFLCSATFFSFRNEL